MSFAIRRELTKRTRLLHDSTLRFPKHAQLAFVGSQNRVKSEVLSSVIQSRPHSTSDSATRNQEPRAAASNSWLFQGSNIRVSTFFTALLALGAGATGLGLYEIYTSFTQWPIQLRKDLRAGVRAKNQGDFALSERFLTRAYQTALDLPLSVLGSDPYLKLSGIAAVLAEVSPEQRSKEVLRSVWEKGDVFSSSSSAVGSTKGHSGAGNASESEDKDDWVRYTLTNEERLRRVAVACKLAELSSPNGDDKTGREEEEKWLTWAVEEVLRLAGVRQVQATTSDDGDATARGGGNGVASRSDNSSTSGIVLAELELPSWMRRVDLGAPLAALGSVYAREGNVEYAMPLYVQAISLLLPPNTKNVSIEDRCEAAQLMNNLSELIMRRPPSPEIRQQAEAWARQAYGIIRRVEETPLPQKGWFTSSVGSKEVCDQVFGVILFNLGMLREMDQDLTAARSLYEQSLKQCEKVGMKEGVVQTKQALRRIGRASGKNSVDSSHAT